MSSSSQSRLVDNWHHWSNLDSLEEQLTVSSTNETDSSRPVSPIIGGRQGLLTGYHPRALQSTILALLAIPIRLWHNHKPIKPGSLTSIQTIPPSTLRSKILLSSVHSPHQHLQHPRITSSPSWRLVSKIHTDGHLPSFLPSLVSIRTPLFLPRSGSVSFPNIPRQRRKVRRGARFFPWSMAGPPRESLVSVTCVSRRGTRDSKVIFKDRSGKRAPFQEAAPGSPRSMHQRLRTIFCPMEDDRRSSWSRIPSRPSHGWSRNHFGSSVVGRH